MFSVNFWGSHPDADNDDCWYGEDFDTLEKAEAAYNVPVVNQTYCLAKCVAFVELTGPAIRKVRPNSTFEPDRDTTDRLWRNEARMQAAMSHGVQGWNDYEGTV